MKRLAYKILGILFLSVGLAICFIQQVKAQRYSVEFYDGTFNFQTENSFNIRFNEQLSPQSVTAFYNQISLSNYQSVLDSLTAYKQKHQLNDWLYYQLIRKTVQQISPKAENYSRYTLYKWFLLNKSGYDARVAVGKNQIIFYVKNDEDISDIPYFMIDNKKYTCLNYHDYGKLFQKENAYKPVNINIPEAKNAFSYKVTKMPDFNLDSYIEKDLEFNYHNNTYLFKVKLNKDIQSIFANYPTVDFETYFNIPLSRETYQSLIPILKKNVKGMNQKKGVDYLMRFTRYAFLYENDEDSFGKEKRLSPEQTLANKFSDCDDRAALFFFLVKEIYNLPMIAMLYPTHITMAVQFDKPMANSIIYNGKKYSVCEPTPQLQDLRIGQLSANLRNKPFEIVYHYDPLNK